MKRIKEDIKANWENLKFFRKELEKNKINLSEIRIFDHLVWIKIRDEEVDNLLFTRVTE